MTVALASAGYFARGPKAVLEHIVCAAQSCSQCREQVGEIAAEFIISLCAHKGWCYLGASRSGSRCFRSRPVQSNLPNRVGKQGLCGLLYLLGSGPFLMGCLLPGGKLPMPNLI